MRLIPFIAALAALSACDLADMAAYMDPAGDAPHAAMLERAREIYCPLRGIGSPAADVVITDPETRETLRMAADELCREPLE